MDRLDGLSLFDAIILGFAIGGVAGMGFLAVVVALRVLGDSL